MFFYIYKLTGFYILSSAFSFVFSKLCFLIAMILPWKILAVASGSGSEYFNYFNLFDDLDNKTQVAYLGAIVVVFFILHLVLEFLFDFLIKKGAEKTIDKNNKIGVFNNYRAFAKRIYENYAVFSAALLYSLLVFVWLTLMYPSLVFSFFIYSLSSFSLLLSLFKIFNVKEHTVSKWLSSLYKIWWHLGFVFGLIWTINDYWKGVMPGLLVTFVSLLLYRQLMVMMTIVFNSGYLIYKNRVRAGQVFSSAPNSEYQVKAKLNIDFEKLLVDIDQQEWLNVICKKEFSSFEDAKLEKACHLIEGGNVAYVTVTPQTKQPADGLLIKFYNVNREALAEQELALLKSAEDQWPLVSFLYSTKINGFLALVCRWPAGSKWLQGINKTAIELPLRNYLLTCNLPESVVKLYNYSQVDLFARLEVIVWEHLQAYSGTASNKVDWDSLQSKLDIILVEINSSPKQLILRSLNNRLIFSYSDKTIISDVTRWAWEPLGSGWPLNRFKLLDEALIEAAKQRPELEGTDPEKAKLVARLYEFERRYQNKNYAGAVNVLSNLLNHFEEMQAKKTQDSEKIES